MIAALQISLDGFTQGEHGEKDWVESWADALGLIPDVDTFVLGAGMYPGYGIYWEAIHAHPDQPPPFQDRLATASELAYARLAAATPHLVLSRSLASVSWPTATIVRDVAALRAHKAQPGTNTYVVGGATLVALLLAEGLIDELRLIIHPVLLGRGQSPFANLPRLALDLLTSAPSTAGRLVSTYRVRPR